MAKGAKKQRKFDRCRKSKRNVHYVSIKMARINKLKKLRRHLRHHPNDKRNASALVTLETHRMSDVQGEFQGPVPSFKPTTVTRPLPDMRAAANNDVEEEFRLHLRKGKEIKLLEQVATREHYEVRDTYTGQTQLVTLFYSEAFAFYEERHSACSLLQRRGRKTYVLKNKAALPPKGFENQIRHEAIAIIKSQKERKIA